MILLIELLKAVLYGVVEGITEWLPISSTGHLILLEEWLPLSFSSDPVLMAEFNEMFQVVIQLGAIVAVILLFWGRLFPFGRSKTPAVRRNIWILWGKVVVASIPAALIGLIVDPLLEHGSGKDISGWLYNAPTVAIALIVYGIAFILIEWHNRRRGILPAVETVDQITCKQALAIGTFQAISIIPGTSRSGSTILGSMLLGLSRTAGAEFSFFMAIPAMLGASFLKSMGFVGFVLEHQQEVPSTAYLVLLTACLVSLLVSLVAIRFLMEFVKKHTFSAFGVYRIVLGVLVLLYFLLPQLL